MEPPTPMARRSLELAVIFLRPYSIRQRVPQDRTHAVQQTLLFDHLVRAKHEAGRDLMPDCLGRL